MGRALVDANVVVGLYRLDDSLHIKAVKLVTDLRSNGWELVITNLLKQEIATVLSFRVGMSLAKKFLKDYLDLIDTEIVVDEDVEKNAWKIFENQNKRGTSFVDCANMAVVEKYKLNGIVTFDEFYPKKLMVQ
jgi:predicted nucleic acid-binding protein